MNEHYYVALALDRAEQQQLGALEAHGDFHQMVGQVGDQFLGRGRGGPQRDEEQG